MDKIAPYVTKPADKKKTAREKGKIYPFCEEGHIPSEDVVRQFSDPTLTVNPDKYYASTPEEAMFKELEGFYNVYHDWTAAYAAMNMD